MITLNTALINHLASTLAESFELGEGDAKLRLYSGTAPATPDTALTDQVLLVELDLPDDAFGDAFHGEVKRAGTWAGTAVAAGTATFFRLVGGDEGYVMQGAVSGANEGGDLQMAKPELEVGEDVQATIVSFTQPSSA